MLSIRGCTKGHWGPWQTHLSSEQAAATLTSPLASGSAMNHQMSLQWLVFSCISNYCSFYCWWKVLIGSSEDPFQKSNQVRGILNSPQYPQEWNISDSSWVSREVQLHQKVLFKCHIQLIPWILCKDQEKLGQSWQWLAHCFPWPQNSRYRLAVRAESRKHMLERICVTCQGNCAFEVVEPLCYNSGKTQPFSTLMGLKLCSLLSPELGCAAVHSFQCVWKELKHH